MSSEQEHQEHQQRCEEEVDEYASGLYESAQRVFLASSTTYIDWSIFNDTYCNRKNFPEFLIISGWTKDYFHRTQVKIIIILTGHSGWGGMFPIGPSAPVESSALCKQVGT